MKKSALLLGAAALFGATTLASLPAIAATHNMDMKGMPAKGVSPMHDEYMKGMDKMHQDMSRGMMEKDADIAFAAGMLPHHEGAVSMAEVELKYGKDPEMRKLAKEIIAAQQGEIKLMKNWLKSHGYNPNK